jgi:hypothetical protein
MPYRNWPPRCRGGAEQIRSGAISDTPLRHAQTACIALTPKKFASPYAHLAVAGFMSVQGYGGIRLRLRNRPSPPVFEHLSLWSSKPLFFNPHCGIFGEDSDRPLTDYRIRSGLAEDMCLSCRRWKTSPSCDVKAPG